MLPRRTRIVLAVLVVASLTFVILDLRGGDGPFSSARAAASAVFGGVQRAATTVFSPVIGASDWWSRQRDQAAQIGELRAENDNLKLLVEMGANDRARAEALDELLRVAGVGRYRIIPAEVIAVGPAQGFAWTVTIDTGTNDGIEQDMTVINGQGLVGRVVKTTTNSSTVVLLVDASAAVGGRIAGSDEIGIVSGTGRQDSLEFQLLDPLAQLRAGDAIVTFGSRGGRPYAPGLPIGEIVDVSGSAGQLTRVATVRPFADVSALSVVAVVVRPPREDPRDSVLPSAPVGSPSLSPSPLAPGAESSVNEEPAATPEPTVQLEGPATPVPAGE
ncbi:MAG: rod shape-determining protein MreC [Candidatus Nanopelagicales bacterium]|jgi:rod shape-determining protein MreC|nr:rod shape-determining protein MreC [Candidatus Nanopelagicales bacterium]